MPLILTRLNPYINRAPKLIFLSAETTKFNYQYRQNTTTVDQMYAFWQAFLGIYYRILHFLSLPNIYIYCKFNQTLVFEYDLPKNLEINKNYEKQKRIFNDLFCTLLQRCNIVQTENMYKFYQSFDPINCN